MWEYLGSVFFPARLTNLMPRKNLLSQIGFLLVGLLRER